jgi:hypothetical protein
MFIARETVTMIRYTGLEFETPPSVPKLPTIDQLPNNCTTAFLKWLKPQNLRMGHNNNVVRPTAVGMAHYLLCDKK